MRAIKSNMVDQVLTDDKKILHCPECGGEYSGNAGDYFMYPGNHVFLCTDCLRQGIRVEMELVTKVVTVKYV